MMGLRLQGMKVLRVVVHVGEGVFLALEIQLLVAGLIFLEGTDVTILRLSAAAMMVEKYMAGV